MKTPMVSRSTCPFFDVAPRLQLAAPIGTIINVEGTCDAQPLRCFWRHDDGSRMALGLDCREETYGSCFSFRNELR